MLVCMYVCMYVYMHVCMYVDMNISTKTDLRIYMMTTLQGKGPLLNETFASLALRLKRGAWVVTLDTVPELDIYKQTGAISREVHQFTGEDLVSWQSASSSIVINLYVYRKLSNDWKCTRCQTRNSFVFWDGERISCNTRCQNSQCHNTKMPNLRIRRKARHT
jgi:hypothetical protein